MTEESCKWFKGVEVILNNTRMTYGMKVDALISSWELVKAFMGISKNETPNIVVQRCFRHTLQLVLQTEWENLSRATKTHLSVTLQCCAGLLGNHIAAQQCIILIGVINDPWGHPVLRRLLTEGVSEVNENEVLELCKAEKGFFLSMRLEILCENKCEDLALNLAEAIYRCLHVNNYFCHEENMKEEFFSTMDIYILLLYKQHRIQDIIKELKHLELEDGLLLVRRHALMDDQHKRLWKYKSKVAKLAADYFLAVAMVKPVSGTSMLLQDLMTEWVLVHNTLPSVFQTLPNMIRKLIQPAESSVHIYLFIEVLRKQFGESIRSLCIELYIRALTTDLNELEQQKVQNDEGKVLETRRRFSEGLLSLADLMKENIAVCQECVLTAFSVNPTHSCFDIIKNLALVSGKYVDKEGKGLQDINSNYYEGPFSGPNGIREEGRTFDAIFLITGNMERETLKCDVLTAPNRILDAETLGLSQQLCDDLTVVLSSPRYHMLSWILDWTELSSMCEKYLESWKEIWNPNKELKFLNIDYNRFKDFPNVEEDEFYGIEKGYEKYLVFSSDT